MAKKERGAALTEVVVIVPVAVMMLYGSMYLTEIGVFKLKTQEATRYAAWSLAVRPLSDFETFDHDAVTRDSRDGAARELNALYVDLDGAYDRPLPKSGRYISAIHRPRPSDVTLQPTQLVPQAMNMQWSEPLSAAGMLLGVLGVGNSAGDLFAGPFRTIGMNTRTQARGSLDVRVMPPLNVRDVRRAAAMVQYGAESGIDMRQWSLLRPGRALRDVDRDGRVLPIQTALVTDPWRVERGYSALPSNGDGEREFGNAVVRVSDRGPRALPLGAVLGLAMPSCRDSDPSITALVNIFGAASGCPDAHLVSRPYTQRRQGRSALSGSPAAGQTNVFRFGGRDSSGQEGGAVQLFDTLPMYYDESRGGPYIEALDARGNFWMGCEDAQARRCEW